MCYNLIGDNMDIYLKIIFFTMIICEILILLFSFKKGGVLRFVTLNAIIGIFITALINMTEKYTGCYIPINPFTVILPASFGIPAVICLILLKFIFL